MAGMGKGNERDRNWSTGFRHHPYQILCTGPDDVPWKGQTGRVREAPRDFTAESVRRSVFDCLRGFQPLLGTYSEDGEPMVHVLVSSLTFNHVAQAAVRYAASLPSASSSSSSATYLGAKPKVGMPSRSSGHYRDARPFDHYSNDPDCWHPDTDWTFFHQEVDKALVGAEREEQQECDEYDAWESAQHVKSRQRSPTPPPSDRDALDTPSDGAPGFHLTGA